MTEAIRDDTAPPPAAPVAEITGSKMRRVATASFVGTVVEFYDFGIYGTAAALVFGPIFFPSLGTAAATVAAFATFSVAFIARPVGAVIFGHIGDRLGRKRTLIMTLLTMGIATMLVGLMPTADRIGAAAPIALVVLRIVQGLAAGGETAGGMLFTAESAPAKSRGFWAMFPSFAGGFSIGLSSGTFLLTAVLMDDEAFISYGWRIPFLSSILLVLVGLWVRLATEETPVFKVEAAQKRTAPIPFLDAFKSQPREILLASGVGFMAFAFNYIAASYLTSYGTTTLELTRPVVLSMGALGGLFLAGGILLSAILSDRIGRRRMLTISMVLGIIWSLMVFPILDTVTPAAFGVGVTVTFFIAGTSFGPLGALYSELFQTRYRYTATALAYNIAGIVGGAIVPLIAPVLINGYGTFSFSLVLVGVSIVSLVCVLRLSETRGRDLTAPM
ncbi:MFS transporter [Rhodococcus koreensis]|uniref:MFS transporter n=1 Tax=Rhodococcus koreensis TaxID=99653 RepID=UPI0036706164